MTIEAPDTGRTHSLRHDLGDGAVESWEINLNFDALTAIEAGDGSRVATARGIPLAGHHVDLPIPDRSTPLRLSLDTVYEGYGGVTTYAGIIDGDDGSLVAISVDGDEILGKIHHSEGFTYLIESALDRPGYTLSMVDQTLIPQLESDFEDPNSSDEAFQVARPGETSSIKGDPIQIQSSSGEVRLLVLYTLAAAQQTNILLLANNLVSSFNQSSSLSGVNSSNYVVLADLRQLSDNFTTQNDRCRDHILLKMLNYSAPFTNLDAWMELAWADIGLTVVTNETGYTECSSGLGRIGGLAHAIPSSSYPSHPTPFAMTTHSYALGDLTAPHEVGHVLNGRHEDDCSSAIPNTACGHTHSQCDWQTMMGGYKDCSFDSTKPPDQQPVVRIARWSNPNVNYSGVPTGTSQHNMATALNINMPYAAMWKGQQDPPPSAPDPINNTPMYCWGQNFVQWTVQGGTVEYRLFQSSSPSFTSPFLVYSGFGTSTFINVSGTAYLRAKACNSGGCSAYSQQVQATYYPACG